MSKGDKALPVGSIDALPVLPRVPNAVTSMTDQVPAVDLGPAARISLESDGGTPAQAVVGTSSFAVACHTELINNECSKALQRSSSHNMSHNLQEFYHKTKNNVLIDWQKQKNRDRLKDLCKLIRNLFWAFEDSYDDCENAPQESAAPRITLTKIPTTGIRMHAYHMTQTEAFGGFFLILTIYALFGPDTAMTLGHTPSNENDFTLAAINTCVFVLFALEELLYCWVLPGYLGSGRFWIDTFATCSIIGDTVIGSELIKSDAAVAGRGSRLIRLVRVGGRSSRVVRMLRLARTTQILKLLPKIQERMERSTYDLALLLWHKRMKHVFMYLDKTGCGRLSEGDMDFFQTSMSIEFPDVTEDYSTGRSSKTEQDKRTSQNESLRDKIEKISVEKVTSYMTSSATDLGTFNQVSRDFFNTQIGKRSFIRCVDDISCMKESCAIVERAIGQLTLKVCVLVLMLLIMMQLLEMSSENISAAQGLNQLDIMAREDVPPSVMCDLVKEQFSVSSPSSRLLLLILNQRVYWTEMCPCCDPEGSLTSVANADPMADGAIVDETMKATGLEAHELLLREAVLLGTNTISSLALFDTHKYERSGAVDNLKHTATVVILLLILIFYFAADVKRLSNNNMLHPLWNLMDDMCSLKSIEVVNERPDESGDAVVGKLTVVSQYMPSRARWKCMTLRQPIPVADELLQLSKALEKLRMAMLSWSKYVPVVLLKQLLEAGVEAKIGCTHCEVSIFFCDIDGFKEMCEGMRPTEVLVLLEMVLNEVYEAIEDNGGTLLEFIGDEVLAIFNAPTLLPGHSMCTVTAALEAQERLDKICSQNSSLPSVKLKMSVHKGNVLTGNIGSPTRMKYGALGDGVNLCARLKSLNTRYGTHLLVSSEAMDFNSAFSMFVTRPIGHLVLKGRTVPTVTYEVLAKRGSAKQHVINGADLHRKGFELFVARRFADAQALFTQAAESLCRRDGGEVDPSLRDGPSAHISALCEGYLRQPPPENWDGSEHLSKKAW